MALIIVDSENSNFQKDKQTYHLDLLRKEAFHQGKLSKIIQWGFLYIVQSVEYLLCTEFST